MEITSVTRHISGTVQHMVMIFGALVQNNNISRLFFSFFKVLVFRFVREKKGNKMPQNDKKFCHTSYLRNRTLYDCHLWCTTVNWSYLQVFFSFFQNFHFSDCQWGKRAKMAQNDKKFCYTSSLRNHTSYDFHLWYTCVE